MKQTDQIDKGPIQLIRFNQNKFEMPSQAKQFLSTLTKPLGIITIVGKYRTGKSLFLNKVLLQNSSAFKVSPTINSCTKGLWVWRQTIRVQNQEMEVLVVDSQGFGAVQESSAYNNKILLMALLISSYFVYNCVGSIDQNSINNLTAIANVAKDIQTNNNIDKIQQQFPSFLWLVRDFTLNLVDKNNNPIQPKEYLQQSLQLQKGVSDMIENKNKIRRMIKHFFSDRDCFTMVRPVDTQEKLQQLSSLEDCYIREEFLEEAAILRARILKKVRVKKIRGRVLNGEMFGELVQSYIQAVNQGKLPNFDTSYRHLTQAQNRQALQKTKKAITSTLQTTSQTLKTPLQINTLQQNLQDTSLETLKQKISQHQQMMSAYMEIKKQIKRMCDVLRRQNQEMVGKEFRKIWGICLDQCGEVQRVQDLEFQGGRLRERVQERLEEEKVPVQKVYVDEKIMNWKENHHKKLISNLQINHKQHQTQITQKLSQLESESQSLHLQKSNLTDKLHLQTNQTTKLTYQLKQLKTVKQLQQKSMKQKEDELMVRNERLKEDLKKKQLDNDEMKKEMEGMRRELEGERRGRDGQMLAGRGLEVQLGICRGRLEKAHCEVDELKNKLAEVSFRLESALERQQIVNTKNNQTIQHKTLQYNYLNSKHSDLQHENLEAEKKISKLQSQLDSNKSMINGQRKIYESMFESFKQSLKGEQQSRQELIMTNKNLSSALQHMQKRAIQSQQKQKNLKQYKKCVKNSSCLQCQHCTKFFAPSIFLNHLNICLIGPQALKSTTITNLPQKPKIQILIKNTLIKDDNGRPYTEYVVEIKKQDRLWTINRKYKDFCQLNAALRGYLPGVQLSEVGYIVNPQEGTKKSMVMEERRKVLEKYLGDLSGNPLVFLSQIWKEFIDEPESSQPSSPLKQNTHRHINIKQSKTPQQFFKMYNERKLRSKQTSASNKFVKR